LISGYKTSSDLKDMDLAVIHDFISNSYWANVIKQATHGNSS